MSCSLAKPDDLATLVYTSGTTGNPKGAMLTHGNIASNVAASLQVLPLQSGWTAMSILPLSHIFERMADYCYYQNGIAIAYAENVTKVGENLQEIRPQVFAAVPRLFEKMRERIMNQVATRIGREAEDLPMGAEGCRRATALPRGTQADAPGLKAKSFLADKLVFRKILARLGGRVKFVSPAARRSRRSWRRSSSVRAWRFWRATG